MTHIIQKTIYRPEKPVFAYDDQCAFCRRWKRRFERVVGKRVRFSGYSEVLDDIPELSEEELYNTIYFIEPDGRMSTEVEAVFRILSQRAIFRPVLWLFEYLPGFAWISRKVYGRISKGRRS